MPHTFKEFVDVVRESINDMGPNLDPEDDWLPMAFLEDEDDALVMVCVDPQFMNEEDGKEILGTVVLPGIVEKVKARKYAFLSTAWMAKIERDSDGEFDESIRLSEHPDRMEVVIIACCDREISQFHFAEIIRTPDHSPMLGPWEASSEQFESRFIDNVKEVMR